MFSKIKIERFRGIRYASIENFSRINLFFGKNNCGKSSLLESLFLASGPSNPLLPVQVNMIRGYGKAMLDDLAFDFYDLDTTQPIHIRLENEEMRDLKINLFKENKDNVSLNTQDANVLSNVEECRYGLSVDFAVNGKRFTSRLRFDPATSEDTTHIVTQKEYKESLRCTYLSPKYDFSTSIQGLKNILQNKDEHFIVEGLQVIEPRVKDFIFTDGAMLVDIGLEKRLPVNMMGDGARKIVALLTTLYNCRDGALLVDEISNGFHYSVMGSLWEVLVQAAIKNNTQLFVTTHDTDSIKGLRDATLNKHDSIVAAFKLQKTADGELKAYHYSVKSLDYSIDQEIEVR